MKNLVIGLLVTFIAASHSPVRGGQPPATNAVPRLTLELTDGSRVVGVPTLDRLKLRTESANLELKLPLVRMIEFDKEHEQARVSLCNGDRLSGQLSPASIEVTTGFGKVQVPLAKVARITLNNGKMALFFGPGSRAICDDAFLPWGKTPLSFSIWCKLPPYDEQRHIAVIIGAETRYYDRMTLYLVPNNSWWDMDLEVYGTNSQFSPIPDVVLPETAGQWIHCCAVFDGRRLTLYKNGVLMSDVPMPLNRLAYGRFAVGNHNIRTDNPFNEALSDLRIWNRALSEEEVGQVYEGHAVADGLIGHWPMNEGGGKTVYDTSGQNHHLTIEGSPTWVDGPPDGLKPTPSHAPKATPDSSRKKFITPKKPGTRISFTIPDDPLRR